MEGHPDKICDFISDAIVDEYLLQDPMAHVGCEVMYKGDFMCISGEVKSFAHVDCDRIAREALFAIGYTSDWSQYNNETVRVEQLITEQSPEIVESEWAPSDDPGKKGATDQGIMFGYATAETAECVPLPILLAQNLCEYVDRARHDGVSWLRPDGKSAVTVKYVDGVPVGVVGVLMACQHSPEVSHATVEAWVREEVVPRVVGEWALPEIQIRVNMLGKFILGGPQIDTGMTGRKLVVDTYGGMGRIGGGALSGKDPSKLDRSGAYYSRWIAKKMIVAGLARRVELQVAFGFAQSAALSVWVNTFGSGEQGMVDQFARDFDFSPEGIYQSLDLARPIYRQTSKYGHFGKPGFPWEVA
ncbi:Methionine adenosyltransferase [Propionibacterium freudenreichii]|nr:Methionine adenosyltransferase [Propionibacterium freudenreichii]SCQ55180.1 Methionine adenosyltransferase [Propionibacterium freudenreichii]